METLFVYLGKASAGIVVFYLVYWLFLRKETFYQANRWFLISALLTSLLIPLFPVHYSVMVESGNNQTVFKEITDAFRNAEIVAETNDFKDSGFNWTFTVFLVYLTGLSVFLLRLISQTAILFYLILKYKPKEFKGIRIVENEKYGLPFSFFNIIFINPKFHTQENLTEILAHENVHIREFHWFDLLLIELLTVIFWFNPFIWFFEQSIKQNHEYLADKGVLAQGHSVAKYQTLLINQLMGMQIIGVTNNLNFGLNANRLKMMTKKKTPQIKGFKLMLAFPVLAFLLYSFAVPEYRSRDVSTTEKTTLPLNSYKSEKMTIHGKVVLKETNKTLSGASIVLKGTSIGTVSDVNGTFTLVNPNPTVKSDGSLSSEVVVKFVGLKTIIDTLTTSGSSKNTKFIFQMEDGVHILINKNYLGEQFIPPPPPPPVIIETKKANDNTPSPPPTAANKDGEEFFVLAEEYPKYPGGDEAMQDYIAKMQQKLAQGKGIKGKAKVGFTVNARGNVTDVKIFEKDNDLAGKEGAQIVADMPDWQPGKQRGKPVSVNYILPLEFK